MHNKAPHATSSLASDNITDPSHASAAYLWSAHCDITILEQENSPTQYTAIPSHLLLPECSGYVSPHSVDIRFSSPFQIQSSSVFNGGYQHFERFINLKVSDQCIVGKTTPQQVFQEYVDQTHTLLEETNTGSKNIDGVIGMMTAASMKSCRIVSQTLCDDHQNTIKLLVMATSGIGNLRAAGDKAEYRYLYSAVHQQAENASESPSSQSPLANHAIPAKPAMPVKLGTINLFIACDKVLSPAAQTEAIMLATEAKVLALHNLNLQSPISEKMATGTGTDAVAVACPHPLTAVSSPIIDFVGKHTLLGEQLGQMVITAVSDSIQKYNPNTASCVEENMASNIENSNIKNSNIKNNNQ